MGRPKALLGYRGRTILEHQVTLYSLFGPVWVAVNQDIAPEVQLLGIPAPVFVMENPAPGLFSTVQPCLKRLSGQVERLFVSPVDCLLPDGRVPAFLLAEDGVSLPVLVPVHGARRGHPVLLSARALVDVVKSAPEARFDQVLELVGIAEVPVAEPRILLNINTPDDYTRFLAADAAVQERR